MSCLMNSFPHLSSSMRYGVLLTTFLGNMVSESMGIPFPSSQWNPFAIPSGKLT